jgi:hypothetical protein
MQDQKVLERIILIEKQLEAIAERNQRVEIEKAWETSTTRVLSVVVLTYALMSLTFSIIGVREYFINAIIPTLGYFLSTQSLPIIKRRWLQRLNR